MAEQPKQENFCCAVASDPTMRLRDKVHWLHICADEYLANEDALAQEVHDRLGAAMLSTTPEGHYVLDKDAVAALFALIRERGAIIQPSVSAADRVKALVPS